MTSSGLSGLEGVFLAAFEQANHDGADESNGLNN